MYGNSYSWLLTSPNVWSSNMKANTCFDFIAGIQYNKMKEMVFKEIFIWKYAYKYIFIYLFKTQYPQSISTVKVVILQSTFFFFYN